ncbi:FUSC family protein [Hyphomicrobium sp.]|uniref:FUSC family protein n=1 Tax=Hyphomicrobium sp. TaxID=82 RepID=UPI001DB7EA00|nr:FUSC family protein [Hyphomicrobium sp.]
MHFPKMPVPSPDVWKAGLRTAVAGGLAYGVADFFALPQGFWAVVTAIVIMGQPRVGASLRAGADRFIGTIVGALAGFLVAMMTPSTVFGTASGLVVSIGVLGILAARDSSFRVVPCLICFAISHARRREFQPRHLRLGTTGQRRTGELSYGKNFT